MRNCTWFGADGVTFDYHGSSSVFENNLSAHIQQSAVACGLWLYFDRLRVSSFAWNDWTCHDDDEHTGMGCAVLVVSSGANDVFTRNSLIGNGPSVGYACGANATMTLNRCVGQADIDNDGVCLQIRSSSAINSTMAYLLRDRMMRTIRVYKKPYLRC